MANIIRILVLLLALSAGANAQFPGMPPQGKADTAKMRSEVLNTDRNYSVYLPKSYASSPEKRYPVLYLLHGLYDNNKGWLLRGHMQDVANQVTDAGDACEMIIIVPDAGTLWNGYFDMEGWNYEKYFFTEFIPFIEKTYRVAADKQHRAIAGLSMGGGGATAYAQKHPEMFSSVYAMSALMNLPEQGRVPARDKKMEALNQSVLANNCVKFIANADDALKEKLRSVRWFVDCGDDDFLFDANIAFFQEMRKAKIPCQLRVRDGGHTWEYWHSALYSALPFVSNGVTR
jgi:S-formylglutathione hydrolase FrmB